MNIVIHEKFYNAYVRYNDDILTVCTGEVERTWKCTEKGLVTTRIYNCNTNKEWANKQNNILCDWTIPDINNEDLKANINDIKIIKKEDDDFTSPHIETIVNIEYKAINILLQYIIWVYPNSPGIRTQLKVKLINNIKNNDIKQDKIAYLDFIPLQINGSIRRAIGYYNDTQHRNKKETEILSEEIIGGAFKDEEIYDWANMLCVESREGDGICVVKESHKCANQVGYETGDFRCNNNGVMITGWGLKKDDIRCDKFRQTWANWCIVYSGKDEDRQLAIKRFDRIRYPIDKDRDIYIMSNTWGSTTNPYDARNAATESSVIKEIESGSDLGIDVVQVDDGWQTLDGTTYIPKGKWKPNVNRYPEGWSNIKKLAKEKNMKLGLWAAWIISDNELIDNYKKGDFKYFKLDFAVLDTYDKIEKVYNNAKNLSEFSNNKVRINWDVTENSPRAGYFFARDLGNIYLENRKPEIPENVVYTPYLVLRDAWQVSKYINLNKFQVPVQNIDMVNKEKSNAYLYSHDYCTAITLMGSPIFFQETKYLSDEARKSIKELLSTYKKYREEIYSGYVFPVGEKPNDESWTGFQCHIPENNSGYILIFRELNNKEEAKNIKLNFLRNKEIRIKNLLTNGNKYVRTDSEGKMEFRIDIGGKFNFYRYSFN